MSLLWLGFVKRVLGYSYMRHRICSHSVTFSLYTPLSSLGDVHVQVILKQISFDVSRVDLDLVRQLSISISYVDSRQVLVMFDVFRGSPIRRTRVELTPEVVRTCRYYVHTHEDSLT